MQAYSRASVARRMGVAGKRTHLNSVEQDVRPHLPTENGESDGAAFDYASVTPSVAEFLKSQADRIRRCATASAINIGKYLIGAKHYLSHGEFLRWVESETGIPARTAQVYMQLAQWSGAKSATVAHLPVSALYILSAPSTPKEFTAGVLSRVKAGERISLKTVKEELKAFREPPRPEADRDREAHGDCTVEATTTPEDAPAPSRNHGAGAVHLHQNGLTHDGGRRTQPSPALAEAVKIIANELSEDDFVRVRDLMTSKSVLDDPELARHLVNAFTEIRQNVGRHRAELSHNGMNA